MVASREQLIFDLLTGKNTLTPTLTKSEKQAKSLTKSLTKGLGKAFSKISGAVFNFKTALAGAGGALFFNKAINEAKLLENSLIGLQSVARNTGENVDFISQQAKELSADGLIPLADVAESLKNLLGSGLNGEKAIEVFKALRQSAAFNRQGQLELGEAVKGAAQGLKNDLSIKVDNAGITKNLSILQKEYADSIGKSVAALTPAEKIQAKYVGILKEAALFQGDYNSLLETFSGAQSKASGESRFLVAEIGQFITKSPVAVEFVAQLAKNFKELRKFLEENQDSIQKFVNNGIKNLVGIAPIAIEVLRLISTGFLKLGNFAIVAADSVVTFLKFLADSEAFRVFSTTAVKSFSFIIDKYNDLIQTFTSSEIGAGIAEKLGLDPVAIAESANSVKEELAVFAASFDGGEVGEKLGKASDKLKEAFLFNDENLESLETGFAIAKEIVDNFNTDIENSDSKRTRIEIANSNKRKNATDKENANKNKSNKAFYDFSIKQEKLTGRQRVQALSSTLGSISTLQNSSSKELFFIGKAAAVANATIDGIGAVQKALNSAPPPFNFALAALVGVASAANIAKIVASKPPGAQTGGILDPNGSNTAGDLLPFRGNSGEAILTKGQQARFIELADGASPEQEGGNGLADEIRALKDAIMSAPTVLEIDGREIARTTRDQIRGGFAIV